ncbi:hypothetical protein SVIOM74S_02400 [Streptomyces violarus]
MLRLEAGGRWLLALDLLVGEHRRLGDLGSGPVAGHPHLVHVDLGLGRRVGLVQGGEPRSAVTQDVCRGVLGAGQAAGDVHVALQRQRRGGTAGRLRSVQECGGPSGQDGIREGGEVIGGLGIHGAVRLGRGAGGCALRGMSGRGGRQCGQQRHPQGQRRGTSVAPVSHENPPTLAFSRPVERILSPPATHGETFSHTCSWMSGFRFEGSRCHPRSPARRQVVENLATYSSKGSMPTSARSSSTRSGSAQGHGTGAPSFTPAICVP